MESVLIQRQGAKKRRSGGERMHRRADVVNEARQRQLCGASTAAYRFCGFANEHGAARARQSDRGRQTVRPRADDDCIVRARSILMTPSRILAHSVPMLPAELVRQSRLTPRCLEDVQAGVYVADHDVVSRNRAAGARHR